VSDLVRKALRFAMRRGFDRGLLEGNEVWVVLGAAALLAHLAGRAMHREPKTLFSGPLLPGDTLEIVHDARP
jgi:hypothetical protein